jgi:hypothetical protein
MEELLRQKMQDDRCCNYGCMDETKKKEKKDLTERKKKGGSDEFKRRKWGANSHGALQARHHLWDTNAMR